jgi:hypothetical protein
MVLGTPCTLELRITEGLRYCAVIVQLLLAQLIVQLCLSYLLHLLLMYWLN